MFPRRGLVLYDRNQTRSYGSIQVGATWDVDAARFNYAINARGKIALAINDLVWDLKQFEVWSLLRQCNPMVGCDLTPASPNISAVRNAGFDLISATALGGYAGSALQFSSNGVNIGGADGCVKTSFAPSTLNTFNNHIAFYSRTNNTDVGYMTGIMTAPNTTPRFAMYATATQFQSYDHQFSGTGLAVPFTNTLGLIMLSRVTSIDIRCYQNGTQLGPTFTTAATGSLPGAGTNSAGMYILGANRGDDTIGAGGSTTTKQCAFWSVGDGMDATQALNYYNAVQKFQNALGRAV